MPVSPSSAQHSAIVTTLRSAGCVFAEDEAELLVGSATTPDDLAAMVERRAAGLPLEHVVGWAGFCGLRIAVDPGVFVPRRRTEFLIEQAAALTRADPAAPPPVIVDLCCGSGAMGVALAALVGGPVELHAADVDPAAVRCARRNVEAVGGRVHEGDLFDPLPAALRGRVRILLANVPYVPTREVELLPAEARVHEARVALDGGTDGLDVLRRVTAQAHRWLAPGGHLLVETSDRQLPSAAEIFAGDGWDVRVARCGERHATVVIGTRPAGGADGGHGAVG